MRQRSGGAVPEGMRVQLSRLFGSSSPSARATHQSNAQWRRTLLGVLRELDRYLAENVATDDVHLLMLHSGLYAAHESLKQEDFWPGYAEGMTRLALVLMGDYPDHRRRKKGRKQDNHYSLSHERSVRYIQTWSQKLATLVAAKQLGLDLQTAPYDALREFRKQFGNEPGYDKFFKWYRQNYPQDYALVF